jgi:uncharacterized membrane protein
MLAAFSDELAASPVPFGLGVQKYGFILIMQIFNQNSCAFFLVIIEVSSAIHSTALI